MNRLFNITFFTAAFLLTFSVCAQNENISKFRQLGTEIPTPNMFRTASGAPGPEYYQQKADYEISVVLDDDKQTITGEEKITYTNNSPDRLDYLWLQLDQNIREKDGVKASLQKGRIESRVSFRQARRWLPDFDGGFRITAVNDLSGKELPYFINSTMMRIDLEQPLMPGKKISFKVRWWYPINNRMEIGGRSGYEHFPEDGNYLYTIAQFFPRMAVYNDYEGWQHKQFLGSGEFTLPFGDYTVNITVPEDHIVAATGKLQNAGSVLTSEQRRRLSSALETHDTPVLIVTPEEAVENEKEKSSGSKTWTFRAENVRDFAFASSRKFIWDAMAVEIGGEDVMAMSYYPKEGNPLWEKYSTRVVAHTLKTYSKYTIDYPYHKAISVHSKWIGMEYPMICFNGGRPNADGTYSKSTKYGMIGVIIHEVGHNFFPMIINSDERQWTWMDEGLNTFVQYLTEQEWDHAYPHRRGPAYKIVDYMKVDKEKLTPIMTNAESLFQSGNNAYAKPATALNILRETVLGRELFDYAFKQYCERWAFKHPTPADLFRTMEDASGTDLDWFWRGWFFTTDHVDISINSVKWYQAKTLNPEVDGPISEKNRDSDKEKHIGYIRNQEIETVIEKDPTMKDFYSDYNPDEVTDEKQKAYERKLAQLDDRERQILEGAYQFYEMEFENVGGLVMPLVIRFEFADGTEEIKRIPAEIWIRNETRFSKVFVFEKEVKSIELDPFLELADTDRNNNHWPAQSEPSRFELYKRQMRRSGTNPMQSR